jgi:hypothetical protein
VPAVVIARAAVVLGALDSRIAKTDDTDLADLAVHVHSARLAGDALLIHTCIRRPAVVILAALSSAHADAIDTGTRAPAVLVHVADAAPADAGALVHVADLVGVTVAVLDTAWCPDARAIATDLARWTVVVGAAVRRNDVIRRCVRGGSIVAPNTRCELGHVAATAGETKEDERSEGSSAGTSLDHGAMITHISKGRKNGRRTRARRRLAREDATRPAAHPGCHSDGRWLSNSGWRGGRGTSQALALAPCPWARGGGDPRDRHPRATIAGFSRGLGDAAVEFGSEGDDGARLADPAT